jgi:hypothetical protein
MNQETNSGTQATQQEKATSNKRNSKASRNRPVLVTPTLNDQVEEISNTTQPVEEVDTTIKVEDARPRRLPKFFSSVGRREKEGTVEADPAAARIARATRGAVGTPASSRANKESKPAESKSNANKVSTSKANAKAAPANAPRPASTFKMKYILGMLLYLVIAEVVGGYERTLLVSNHLDKLLIQLWTIPIYTSTVLFLLTLVIVLVILARFDLVPRSLGALAGQPRPTTQRGKSGQSQKDSGSDSDKSNPPTMKQGIKGADDDLYQEYREQQRYLQRRERKK